MRVLGFSKRWEKLERKEFTTFRYPRADSDKGRDWHVGENVQIVLHPRSKGREVLGTARIFRKEERNISQPMIGYISVSDEEAEADGFEDTTDMGFWIENTYGKTYKPIINKFTMRWIKRAEVKCQ